MKRELKTSGPADLVSAGSFRIMGLDPGGKTGWISASRSGANGDIAYAGGQLGPHDHHCELYELLNELRPQLVVCEGFNFIQHKGGEGKRDKVELISCEYIGVTKMWCMLNGVPYVSQIPAERLQITNDKLEKLGLFTGRVVADKDFHDAARHLVTYLVFKMRIKKGIADKWL